MAPAKVHISIALLKVVTGMAETLWVQPFLTFHLNDIKPYTCRLTSLLDHWAIYWHYLFFVLLSKEVHTELTTHHFTSTPSVYRYVPPTRKTGDNRGEQPIINTSGISFKCQIKSKTLQLTTQCNKLWSDICKNHGFDSKLRDLFTVHSSQLPTMYVLVKTHKFSTEHLATREDILDICKLRPIISCCGSPTEKLSWICTTILSPLLKLRPNSSTACLQSSRLSSFAVSWSIARPSVL